MPARVTVIGDAVLDVLATPARPMREGADVPAAISLGPGGQGANVAVRLARRGVAAELVCVLGDDDSGRLVRERLAAESVTLTALAADATGAVLVLLDGAGERTMLSQRALFGRTLADRGPETADWVVVSGYPLLEASAEATATAVGRRHGRCVLLGCAVPDERIDTWRRAATLLRPDLVIVNRDEAERLGNFASDRLVVTDAEGATATVGEAVATLRIPAGPPPVDTTGAGDAFAAAFLATVLDRWPPEPGDLRLALDRAGTAGRATTRVLGAQGRIPGEDDGTLPA